MRRKERIALSLASSLLATDPSQAAAPTAYPPERPRLETSVELKKNEKDPVLAEYESVIKVWREAVDSAKKRVDTWLRETKRRNQSLRGADLTRNTLREFMAVFPPKERPHEREGTGTTLAQELKLLAVTLEAVDRKVGARTAERTISHGDDSLREEVKSMTARIQHLFGIGEHKPGIYSLQDITNELVVWLLEYRLEKETNPPVPQKGHNGATDHG